MNRRKIAIGLLIVQVIIASSALVFRATATEDYVEKVPFSWQMYAGRR